MSAELAAALVALAVAAAREARWLLEQRARRRGELQTRRDDGCPKSEG